MDRRMNIAARCCERKFPSDDSSWLPAGVSKVFTHLRCRDLPINHCNSACSAPSRVIRVRICISDYTGREGGNGPRVRRRARGDRMHKYVTSHRCFAFPSNWPLAIVSSGR